jgi:hypothetical protein
MVNLRLLLSHCSEIRPVEGKLVDFDTRHIPGAAERIVTNFGRYGAYSQLLAASWNMGKDKKEIAEQNKQWHAQTS